MSARTTPAPTRPFVLVDRDGTLIVERHYLSDPSGVELLPGAGAAIARLAAHGVGVAVVTNQSGVGRGYFDLAAVDRVHARMNELLADAGARVDAVYVCPHLPDAGCSCRKPLPGLVFRAARDFGFDPRSAVVVGDKACDVDLGRAVGARTVLVRTGYGAEVEAAVACRADHVADDLAAAVDIVLEGRSAHA